MPRSRPEPGDEDEDEDKDDDEEREPGSPDGPPPGNWMTRDEADALRAELRQREEALDRKLASLELPRTAPAPAPPPSTTAPKDPREERYKNIPLDERHKLTEGEKADVEQMLKRGERPTELLDELGLPANRFTLDQVRSISRRLQNTGEVQALARPTSPLSGLKEVTELVDALRKAGLVYTPADMQKLRDENEESDSEVSEYKELAKVGKEIVVELADAARDITGHPKKRLDGAINELREKTTRAALPPPAERRPPAASAAPVEVTPASAPPHVPAEAVDPEFFTVFARLQELAPRIWDLSDPANGPEEVIHQNVLKDATVAASSAWLLASNKKPKHDWGAGGVCSRCATPRTTDSAGARCERGRSQKDMLRMLKGYTVKRILELVGQYRNAVELNTPLDQLEGLTLRQYVFEKHFGPTDDMDLGGNTLYDTITSVEGLHWLARFLGELQEKIQSEENSGSAPAPPSPPVPVAAVPVPPEPVPPMAEARS